MKNKIKKSIFLFAYFVILLFLIWQGIFWVGEYRQYNKYNEIATQTNTYISFKDWALNHSVFKVPFLGKFFAYEDYKEYVALNKTFNKPIISFEDWGKDTLKSKKSVEEWISKTKEEIEEEKNDIYAGDTPEETWEIFLNALEDGDIELASKYFVKNRQEENLEWFRQVKEAGMLEKMVEDLSVSGLDIVFDGERMKDYKIIDKDRIRNAYVRLRKNINNKWKVESI